MGKPRPRPATAGDRPRDAATPRQCFWCYGTGRVPNDHHERYDRCDSCGGTGIRKPSPAIRPHGQPAVEIVAAEAA